jgi:hypothetical protein
MPLAKALHLFIIVARAKTFLDRGEKTFKGAMRKALKSSHWPDPSEREFERLLTFMRRQRKNMGIAKRSVRKSASDPCNEHG